MEDAAPVAEHAVRDHLDEVTEEGASASSRAARSPSSARTCAPCGGTPFRSTASVSQTHAHPARRPPACRPEPSGTEERGRGPTSGRPRRSRRGPRVDRAVPAGDRAQPRFRLPLLELVAPVEALPVGAVGRLEHEPAADVRDLRVGEVLHGRRSASGAQVAFASEKATISPLVSRTAPFCAATLPPRGSRSGEHGLRSAPQPARGCGRSTRRR